MGKETKMRRILACVALVVCISGCDAKVFPDPKIEVEGHDTTTWSGITVKYCYHQGGYNGEPPLVRLNTPEDVAQYKTQVEFLLDQLEDAERKMEIRADHP